MRFERRNQVSTIWTLVALKIAVLFALAWNRRIVMDEFAQLGWAKYIGHGLYSTIWPAKSMGFAVFIDLAHMIGWDGESILLIGRMETAALACGTLGIIYALARTLGETPSRSALVVLVLLSFSNFIERIFETRAEPLAVFFAAASLLVAVRADPDRPRDALAAGLLTGLAFLSTQKSVYFNVALGLSVFASDLLARRLKAAFARGVWLMLGWALSIAAYCLIFGGIDPAPVLRNLLLGPLEVATHGADAYGGGIRHYVMQTLRLNAGLYAFCFVGMILELARFRRVGADRRIALIFTLAITVFVFMHNQPWPYVFIMAQPFMALWVPVLFNRLAAERRLFRVAWALLAVAVAVSFARNFSILRIGNRAQLELVARAERLLPREQVYFDGVSMLPDRSEPSTLWLDRTYVLKTRNEGKSSEAYRIFEDTPPRMIIWTYRMDAIAPVAAALIRNSYVQVAPNIRLAGMRLRSGVPSAFNVPLAGRYALYDAFGRSAIGSLQVNGHSAGLPVMLQRGMVTLTLRDGPAEALLVPQGSYAGLFRPGADNATLFQHVYD